MNALAKHTAPRARLQDLLVGLCTDGHVPDVMVTGVTEDSRDMQPGSLFIAKPGATHDGRCYIGDAVAAGATAILYERDQAPRLATGEVPACAVHELQQRTGLIAERFYGHPSQALRLVVFTGTNGKTTCAHLAADALTALGGRCGVIGTLGVVMPQRTANDSDGDHVRDHNILATDLTTPGAVAIRRALVTMKKAGASTVFMEGSSHGLAQHRLDDLRVHTAVFTNLSRDHLDYHGDIANYGAAKARLFTFAGLKNAVVNVADPFAGEIMNACRAEHMWTFDASPALGGGQQATSDFAKADVDVRALAWQPRTNGMHVHITTPSGCVRCASRLIGRANLENLVAVVTILVALGYEDEAIGRVLPSLQPVPGRMECIHQHAGAPASNASAQPLVIVDYAHTPEALENALASLSDMSRGNLWCVFGCGGARDRGKRRLMGAISERYADHIILTDDNPRGEDATVIVADIIAGMKHRPRVQHDRAAAIALAISEAATSDTVLIAGKGHETTQEINGQLRPLSDRVIARACMEKRA